MSRSITRFLQQAIEAITGGGSVVTCNCVSTSDLLSATTDSTSTSLTLLTGDFRVFGIEVSNQSGSTVEVFLTDSGTKKIHFGAVQNDTSRSIVLGPNYVNFATNVTADKSNTGSVRYSVLYHDSP